VRRSIEETLAMKNTLGISPSSAAGLVALLFLGLAPGAARGVVQGRILGTVSDETGAPLPGVTIVVTTDALDSFRHETTTDERGGYAITLKDATLTYKYVLSKEGYESATFDAKIAMNTNSRRDVTLRSAAAAAADATAAAAGTATGIFNEGALAAQAGDYPTAIAKFQEAVALDPALAPGWAALATIFIEQHKYAEAAAMADKAVALAPDQARNLRLRYEAWRLAGDAAKAAEAQAALERLDPKGMVVPLVNQGIEAFNAGDIAKATAALEEALTHEPTNVKALYTLALCYVNAGDTAKAKATFERYLAVAPPDDPDLATAKEMISYL
jgi:Tfp pilus assembly protein PilF